VDDRQTDSGLPPAESQEALSESRQPGSMTSEATDTESTQALTTSSNGPSPRKIEANRKNTKKSTGPKNIGRQGDELLEQYLARVTFKATPPNWGAPQARVRLFTDQPATGFGTSRHVGGGFG
jgi:hypothetical protein